MFSVADLIYMAFAGILTKRLRKSSRMQLLTQRQGGAFLVGLGLHAVLQKGQWICICHKQPN